MGGAPLVVATLVAATVAAVVGFVGRPATRLNERVRAYRPGGAPAPAPGDGPVWSPRRAESVGTRLFGPPLRAILGAVGPFGGAEADRRLAERLRAAGRDDDVEAFRIGQFGRTALAAGAGLAAGALVLEHAPLTLLLAACAGAAVYTREPARLARLVEDRRLRMRLELVTVDLLLAIHVRAGAGPVQAITRIVERGHGEVVDELRAILASIRAGRSEADAFRHAASITTEPHAARTFRLFALAAEQGADLGVALRALSDDLRDVRREELRREATRRRAAMLIPTIAVLAPIMLLFVVAPLPSIVLGGR